MSLLRMLILTGVPVGLLGLVAPPALAQATECKSDGERRICPVLQPSTSSDPPSYAMTPGEKKQHQEWLAERRRLKAERRWAKEERRRVRKLTEQANKLIEQAEAANRAGQYDRGLALCRQALRLFPDDPVLRANVMRYLLFLELQQARQDLANGNYMSGTRAWGWEFDGLDNRDVKTLPDYANLQSRRRELADLAIQLREAMTEQLRANAEAAERAAEARRAEEVRIAEEVRRAAEEAKRAEEARLAAESAQWREQQLSYGPPQYIPDGFVVTFKPDGTVRSRKTQGSRYYARYGNGWVGGTTSQIGYYTPVGASSELVANSRQKLRNQGQKDGRNYEEDIDLDTYNYAIGVADNTTSLDWRRTVMDQLKTGKYTTKPGYQPAYNSLRNREFDRLGCHSNGAMICLAALMSEDVLAKDVVLYGPQITPYSLGLWNELLKKKRIKTLKIVVNQNDPVPPLALLVSTSGAKSKVIRSQARSIFYDVDALAKAIRHISPKAIVSTHPCSAKPEKCHEMRTYTELEK